MKVFKLVKEAEIARLGKNAVFSTYDIDAELDFDKIKLLVDEKEYTLEEFAGESTINYVAVDEDRLVLILTHRNATKNIVVLYEFAG